MRYLLLLVLAVPAAAQRPCSDYVRGPSGAVKGCLSLFESAAGNFLTAGDLRGKWTLADSTYKGDMFGSLEFAVKVAAAQLGQPAKDYDYLIGPDTARFEAFITVYDEAFGPGGQISRVPRSAKIYAECRVIDPQQLVCAFSESANDPRRFTATWALFTR